MSRRQITILALLVLTIFLTMYITSPSGCARLRPREDSQDVKLLGPGVKKEIDDLEDYQSPFKLDRVRDRRVARAPSAPRLPARDLEPFKAAEAPAGKIKDDTKKISAKRLVASLFLKIETEKLSDTEWVIKLPTTVKSTENFAEVLPVVIKKLSGLLGEDSNVNIYFKTSLGRMTLKKDGLLIKSLSSVLKSKCGIKDSDIIKSVNARDITSIGAISGVFSNVSKSAGTVTVKLLRNGEERTHVYLLK